MRKLLVLFLFLCMVTSSFATDQWREDGSEATILGSESAADIDAAINGNVVVPLDLMLSNYRRGTQIAYASTSTLTVEAGEVMLSNSAGTSRLMQKNTTSTTVAWTDIDTGAEAASKTYYVWAFQATTSDTDFDVTISASSTAPSGKTYYRRLGSFYNDSSSNITNIANDEDKRIGEIYDYGSSISSYTVRDATSVKICYGSASVAGNGSAAIVNLPFTSASTYSAMAIIEDTNDSADNCIVQLISGSALTIHNSSGNTETLGWIAIGI